MKESQFIYSKADFYTRKFRAKFEITQEDGKVHTVDVYTNNESREDAEREIQANAKKIRPNVKVRIKYWFSKEDDEGMTRIVEEMLNS